MAAAVLSHSAAFGTPESKLHSVREATVPITLSLCDTGVNVVLKDNGGINLSLGVQIEIPLQQLAHLMLELKKRNDGEEDIKAPEKERPKPPVGETGATSIASSLVCGATAPPEARNQTSAMGKKPPPPKESAAAAVAPAADPNSDVTFQTPIAKLQETEARKEYDNKTKWTQDTSQFRTLDWERFQKVVPEPMPQTGRMIRCPAREAEPAAPAAGAAAAAAARHREGSEEGSPRGALSPPPGLPPPQKNLASDARANGERALPKTGIRDPPEATANEEKQAEDEQGADDGDVHIKPPDGGCAKVDDPKRRKQARASRTWQNGVPDQPECRVA